jgi:hypothetical protein
MADGLDVAVDSAGRLVTVEIDIPGVRLEVLVQSCRRVEGLNRRPGDCQWRRTLECQREPEGSGTNWLVEVEAVFNGTEEGVHVDVDAIIASIHLILMFEVALEELHVTVVEGFTAMAEAKELVFIPGLLGEYILECSDIPGTLRSDLEIAPAIVWRHTAVRLNHNGKPK